MDVVVSLVPGQLRRSSESLSFLNGAGRVGLRMRIILPSQLPGEQEWRDVLKSLQRSNVGTHACHLGFYRSEQVGGWSCEAREGCTTGSALWVC